MNNILITGANGQLGSELQYISTKYDYNFIFTNKSELDITDFGQVDSFCIKNKITTIINCAAYTAVDKAENEIEKADLINHIAVKNLGEISKKYSIVLVHISTDYIFDGCNNIPYKENDLPNPIGVYAMSKYRGEQALLDINPKNSIIIRTSWIYSPFNTNFLKTILRLAHERKELKIVFDQIGTPTYALDLAKTILDIIPKINNNAVELFHYSNEGVTSWYDFAQEIISIKKLDTKILPIETHQYPTPAKRPHFSVLNKSKIKDTFKIDILHWKLSLEKCLSRLV